MAAPIIYVLLWWQVSVTRHYVTMFLHSASAINGIFSLGGLYIAKCNDVNNWGLYISFFDYAVGAGAKLFVPFCLWGLSSSGSLFFFIFIYLKIAIMYGSLMILLLSETFGQESRYKKKDMILHLFFHIFLFIFLGIFSYYWPLVTVIDLIVSGSFTYYVT